MTPEQAYDYCVEHGRNAELEKIILADTECAFLYALDVIECRWSEAENVVLTDPEYAYLYAKYVIKDRWIEAESIITTSSQRAYYYAVEVIKGKLPENMHNAMLLHADEWAKRYFEFINKSERTTA